MRLERPGPELLVRLPREALSGFDHVLQFWLQFFNFFCAWIVAGGSRSILELPNQ
jgi:hypothetical protein